MDTDLVMSVLNEAVYLKVILERVRGYEAIFEETLSEKEIYDIIK
jgi:hypothetical protein